MIFRIFDHLLANHTWSMTGDLRLACEHSCIKPGSDVGSCQASPAQAETASLLDRLVLRTKSDRVMSRAAKRLIANPSMPLDQIARELGVTERYLLSGLRAALGVDPQCVFPQFRESAGGT